MLSQLSDQGKRASSALDLALQYAAAGLGVVPLHRPDDFDAYPCTCGAYRCASAGKHPRTRHGLKEASTDPAQVRTWWRSWPRANVGVVPPAGLVVLDVDVRHGGHDTLCQLLARHGALPRTLTARTGGGGAHLWFRCPGPVRGKLGLGVDVKSSTGFLVAPPSVHASGDRYEWAVVAPVAPAPPWLRAALRPAVAPVRSSVSGGAFSEGRAAALALRVAEAVPGERNSVLYWAACRAYESGGGREALDLLRRAAAECGLDANEIARTLASASRAAGAAA